jgi:hypothetical protein
MSYTSIHAGIFLAGDIVVGASEAGLLGLGHRADSMVFETLGETFKSYFIFLKYLNINYFNNIITIFLF